VVNKSGELGGYGGGVWRKRKLLDLEKKSESLDNEDTLLKREGLLFTD
jgi:hypothetical protein